MKKSVLLIFLLTSLVCLVGGTLPSKSENLLGTPQQGGGDSRLISVKPLPETDGEFCEWVPASATAGLLNENMFQLAALQQDARPGQARAAIGIPGGDTSERPPLRVIHDSHAAFSSVSVDPVRNEVAVSDENMFAIMVYDRLANTDANGITKPKRIIQGRKTNIQFTCGVYMDPSTGEIYALNNDTQDKMVVFGPDQEGDVAPARMLQPPHAAFGIATNEEANEFYLTIQHSHSVVVYKKGAKGDDDPIRLLQGNSTKLANPHGIALDTKNKLMFVSNQGDFRTILPGATRGGEAGEDGGGGPQRTTPRQNWPMQRTANGSGRILPSSITVYPLDGQGDLPPLRVLQGPKTQLNWPIGMAVDPDRRELYVANDVGDSVLVFSIEANGDTAPIRKIQGPRSRVKNPTGLFLDRKNDELWVSNFGSHSLTVFKPTASGDAAPLRTIQSAPSSEPSLMIGNPGALAYDTKREQLLVAN